MSSAQRFAGGPWPGFAVLHHPGSVVDPDLGQVFLGGDVPDPGRRFPMDQCPLGRDGAIRPIAGEEPTALQPGANVDQRDRWSGPIKQS